MSKPVILTGLRANNYLHIGNYLGALLPMIDMAKKHAGEYQINLFVPDLHSFTTPIDHAALQAGIKSNLRVFVAAGLPLDNDDIHIYRQSYIPAHSELTWILDCFVGFGEMSRMTQFKDKSGRLDLREEITLVRQHISQMKDELGKRYSVEGSIDIILAMLKEIDDVTAGETSVGLFNYPVLMAADILLYGATYVPVGDDQSQHLEFTRDIATRMNNKFRLPKGKDGQFGELFVVPKAVKQQHEFFNKDQGLRIRDLMEPTKKMSKSDETGKGVIFLTDTPDVARKKIMSAETDSFATVQYDYDQQPGISNLLDILRYLGGNPDEFIGQEQYGSLKKAVADKVALFLEEFQTTLSGIDDAAIEAKLVESEKALNEAANKTLLKVQRAVGLRP